MDLDDVTGGQTDLWQTDAAPADVGAFTGGAGALSDAGGGDASMAQDAGAMAELFGGRFDEQGGCFPGAGPRPSTAVTPRDEVEWGPEQQAGVDRARAAAAAQEREIERIARESLGVYRRP
jgi:hypothetical protein